MTAEYIYILEMDASYWGAFATLEQGKEYAENLAFDDNVKPDSWALCDIHSNCLEGENGYGSAHLVKVKIRQ